MSALRRFYFDWNVDHITGAWIKQAYCAAILHAIGVSMTAALLGGALAAIHWYHARENAQYEYLLERTQGYNPHPQSWPEVVAYLKAKNPFVWPQRWDFFAPAIASIAVCATWVIS